MTESVYELSGKRVFVAGHRGMVGSAIVRALQGEGCEILTAPHPGVDLRRPDEVEPWLLEYRPHAVFLAAARVGGIVANDSRPAEFIHDNLAIETAVVEGARRAGVEKLLFLGSSCIYPRMAKQPIQEEALLTGPLEPTNEWYAIAKIAGVKMCQAYRRQHGCDYISLMPTNLYGQDDNFDPEAAHVIPALMRRMHEARLAGADEVVVWGTGAPRREFLHVDDLADAAVHLMRVYSGEPPVNVGTGKDVAISEAAELIRTVVGFQGAIRYDRSRPDGVPRKRLDVGRLAQLGWSARIPLREGLESTYRWFVAQGDRVRGQNGTGASDR